MVCGRPGPAPQTAKREQYAGLIARGVPSAEACRLVVSMLGQVSGGGPGGRSLAAAAAGCTVRL